MSRILRRRFYNRSTLVVARDLLGKHIVRRYRGKRIVGRIVETEAYRGPHDKGSHTYGGRRTKRTEAMYWDGGHVYVYLVYGMYWQLNFSTAGKEKPEAVLIRALEPVIHGKEGRALFSDSQEFENRKLRAVANGPGKLCRFLKVNRSLYGEDVTVSRRIWIEDRGGRIQKKQIVAAKRIGIDYAGPVWANKKWRFYLKGNPCVSKIAKFPAGNRS